MEPGLLTLPYWVAKSERLDPLPTPQEVEKGDYLMHSKSRVRIVRCGTYAVKYGPGVDPIEASNMIFVREKTNIPVPKVYAVYQSSERLGEFSAFHDTDETRTYIITRFLDDYQTLDDMWESLNAKNKIVIMSQLRDYMDQLRSIEGEGYYGSTLHGDVLDVVIFKGMGNGPELPRRWCFDEPAFNHALLDRIRKKRNSTTQPYLQAIPTVFRGHKAIFTHNDFQRQNILVKRNPAVDSKEDTFDVTIIDWETSGYYPSYWEFSMALISSTHWDDDWHLWLDHCLDPFYTEYAWMSLLHRAR